MIPYGAKSIRMLEDAMEQEPLDSLLEDTKEQGNSSVRRSHGARTIRLLGAGTVRLSDDVTEQEPVDC